MGGYRGISNGWRPHIESAKAFALDSFKKCHGNLSNRNLSGTWCWWRGEKQTGAVSYWWNSTATDGDLVLSYRINDVSHETRIALVTQPMNFGGVRWLMLCPASGRRATKLYLFPGLTQFVHREAISPKPTYSIQRTSGLDKIIQQRWDIREKLGTTDCDDLFDVLWCKPKGMHWSTFKRYQQRDRELMAQEGGIMSKVFGPHLSMDLGSVDE